MKKQYPIILLIVWLFACQTPVTPSTDLSHGIDANMVSDLTARLQAGSYGQIESYLIQQNGEMIMEAYFGKNNADTRHAMYSVTKSVASIGIGLAQTDGYIQSLNDPILSFFPQYDSLENDEARKQDITLENVLTMTPGFAWDEFSYSYGDRRNSAGAMAQSNDWLKFVLDREMASNPGTAFTYNSGNSMLLSGVLQQTTGESAEDYIAARLFAPLGIVDWRWEQGRPNISATGWGLHLRPQDMVKIGQFYLQEGVWDGVEIMPASYIHDSTQPHIQVDENFNYGYQWWRFSDDNEIVSALATNDVYFAAGLGGQYIYVVPHLDLVIATTASNIPDGSIAHQILADFVFPALSE